MSADQVSDRRYVLTLSCPDRTGIVARITTFLADIGGWITEAAYHSDDESGRFFTRQEIRADAAKGLDALVTIMKDNPDINIELASHTDSRAKDNYNLTLSQKRAQSAVDYIIAHGVDKKRITAKGYGESKLVNKCSNGVKCTETEHQQNRRTEFKVTSFGG